MNFVGAVCNRPHLLRANKTMGSRRIALRAITNRPYNDSEGGSSIMTYANLEQRMAQYYLDLLPPFVADEKADIGIDAQRECYQLMHDLYQLAYHEPLLFVPKLHDDDAYPNRFNKSSYGKPKLIEEMRAFLKAMDALLKKLYQMGKGIDAPLNRRERAILGRLGVDIAALPEGFIRMCTREGASYEAFTHCLFDRDYPYTSDIYARLLGESAFRRFEQKLLDAGYLRADIHHATSTDCDLSLNIYNPKWSDELPMGGFLYKIKHAGISFELDFFARESAVMGLCIPNGLKPYLERFSDMSENLKRFVISRANRCGGCKYCIQTDKTKKRPLACIEIELEGAKHSICPYFPGGSFSWTALDDALADDIFEMLMFMDRFIG